MYQTCSVVCKVEDFKSTSNNFRSEFIGKDQSGRKQYRGISFKKNLIYALPCLVDLNWIHLIHWP